MKKVERVIGGLLLVATIIFGLFFLQKQSLILRLVVGFGFGYTLSRGFLGFAGSVNRAYNIFLWCRSIYRISNSKYSRLD